MGDKGSLKEDLFLEYIALGDNYREAVWDEMRIKMNSIQPSISENTAYIIINSLLLRIYSFLRYFSINISNLRPHIGQIIFRSQLESYFYFKYILFDVTKTLELCESFRDHGLGEEKKIKLQYQKYIEQGIIESNSELESFINSSSIGEKRDETIDVNFGMFENMNKLCEYIGEKYLYDTQYAIGSQYSHGSYNILKYNHLKFCTNPLHKFHLIPMMEDFFYDGEEINILLLIDSIDIFIKAYTLRTSYYKIESDLSNLTDQYVNDISLLVQRYSE